jgi:hypothetical protein
MNPWFGYALVLLNIVGTVVIRAPHGSRSFKVPIVENRRGRLELVLLAMMWLAMVVLPPVAIFTPVLRWADYPLHPAAFAAGAVALVVGLYVFHRSHADLGTNWSITLQLR